LSDDWGSELIQFTLADIYHTCGQPGELARIADRFFEHINKNGYDDPVAVAFVYRVSGQNDEAFKWQRIAFEERAPSAYLFNIPMFYEDDFFNDPRHQEILKGMGLVR